MKRLTLALLSLASCLTLMAAPVHIYVSPQGSDGADGRTPATALRTPAMALRMAREVRRLHRVEAAEWRQRFVPLADTLFIHLADGVYRLSEPLMIRPEDSGTPASPTVWQADHAGKAVLSGGVAYPVTGKGEVTFSPTHNGRTVETRQLWLGDRKVPRASLVPLDSMIQMVDFRKDEREIWIPASCLAGIDLAGIDDPGHAPLEMLVHQRWAIALLRIRQIRLDGEVAKVSFHDPESRLEFEHPWPQPIIAEDRGDGRLATSSFNILGDSRLLRPGTWCQEADQTVRLSLPADGGEEATVPVLTTLVEVSGSLERPVHDVMFRGVSFQHAAWQRPSQVGHVTLQGGMYLLDAYKLHEAGLPEKEYLENQAWIARPEAAVEVRGAQRVDFYDCDFSHLGATGLDYVWADSACRVERCHFHDIGGTALALGAFPDRGFETHVPFRPVNMQELCKDFHITHNLIEDATNEDWGCVGIGAGYVADCVIEHNELRDLNYSGICVGWGWTPLNSGMRNNHIRHNYVHHFARRLYDAGGIYTLSYQPGSTIDHNRIDHIYQPLGKTLGVKGLDAAEVNPYATNLRGFYIYLDEATDGYTISNNWCPDIRFGDNRPGPDVHWHNNGPEAPLTTH